jgi:hypothetical protein
MSSQYRPQTSIALVFASAGVREARNFFVGPSWTRLPCTDASCRPNKHPQGQKNQSYPLCDNTATPGSDKVSVKV